MRSTILALAASATLAVAQSSSTDWLSYCTIPTMTWANDDIQTITQTYTSTYCPMCSEVVTTYQTVYDQFCPTGLSGQVYTITETCSPDCCRTGLPTGFTTTVAVCTECGTTPVTATLTQPCTEGTYATQTQAYVTAFAQPTGGSSTVTITQSCAATPCPVAAASVAPSGYTTTVSAGSTYTVAVTAGTTAGTTAAAAAAGTTAGTTAAAAQPYTGGASSNNAGAVLAGVAAMAALVL